MLKLAMATAAITSLALAAPASAQPQDQAWVDSLSLAANTALNSVSAQGAFSGVVYAPVSVDAYGHPHLQPGARVCGAPELGPQTLSALKAMRSAPRPPEGLADQPVMLRIVFTNPDAQNGDAASVIKRCS